MIAARTRLAALAVVIFFALTSILWGSTAAHAADGLSISGTVYLGSNDTPATTGTVQVEYTVVGDDHVAADFVSVASDGTWTIPGLSSGNYFIYYHYLGSAGYASKYQSQEAVLTYPYAAGQTVLGDTSLTGLGEVLEKTGTVSGHVILGTAVATAGQVSVTASVFAGESNGTAQYTTLTPVNTDASGNYTITGLAPGSNWRLFFTSNVTGFQSVYFGQVLDDDGQSFSVDGGATLTKNETVPARMSISGHVYLGTTATAAGGGDVTLQLREYNGGVLNTTPILTTTTAVGGGYSFTGLDNRQFQVTPVYSGSGAFSDGTAADFSATTTTADFTLPASGSTTTYALTGHVDIGTEGNSAQANEIYVGLLTADQETLVTTTLTDANGDYSFPGLVAGSYHVVYANYLHPNQDSWPVYSLAEVGPGLTAPSITFPVYNISGQVNLAGTTAARAGDVTVRASNGAGFLATTSTDASGHYTFSLPEGKYTVGFRFAGDATDDVQTTVVTYSDLRQLMNSDQTVPTPAMTAYDWISGTVTLPSGASPVAVTVYADRFDADGNFVDRHSQTLPTGAGAYAFTKLPLGTYDVSFLPADGSSVAPQQYNDKSIYDDAPTDLVGTAVGGSVFANTNAVLHAGGTVAGSVFGAPDYDNNDVFVEVLSFDLASSSYDETGDFAPVAADGTYRIDGLLPGSYVIEATYSGPAGDITVDSGAISVTASVTKQLDIQLAQGLPTGSPRGSLDGATSGAGTITVSGWALDPDTFASTPVHVYLDGVFQGQFQADQTRSDIAAAFPGYGSSHGYSVTLSNVQGGTHTVCTYGINVGPNAGNTTLGCRTLNVPVPNPIGSLDAVIAAGPGAVTVSGWAIDPDVTTPIAVHAYVDGVGYVLTADAERQDIANAYPAFGADHGYSTTLYGVPAGTHQVCAYGINEGAGTGNTQLGCRAITVRAGDPFGSFDAATVAGVGEVTVGGWAIDPDSVSSIPVHVYVDGAIFEAVTASGTRDDLAAAFPGYGSSHGVSTTLTGLAGGSHTICLYAINQGSGSNNPQLGCKTVKIPTGDPFGALDAAAAVAGGVTLGGWAIDPDSTTTVTLHVYVDGVFNHAFSADALRADVGAAYPGYGDDHGYSISVTDVSVGSHNVCVYGINQGAGNNSTLGCRSVTVTTASAPASNPV